MSEMCAKCSKKNPLPILRGGMYMWGGGGGVVEMILAPTQRQVLKMAFSGFSRAVMWGASGSAFSTAGGRGRAALRSLIHQHLDQILLT